MKIAFFAYRYWAKRIAYSPYLYNDDNIYDESFQILQCTKYSEIAECKPNIIFFIGWSEIIPQEIINNYLCICLHPSPLPKYRGGSPIQNQIINGEDFSAVTFFIMNGKIDAGDILFQQEFSLHGNLEQIFTRIIDIGVDGINYILDNFEKIDEIRKPQDLHQGSFHNRRKPWESEIIPSDFGVYSAKQLHDKIRALNNPYPNAYVVCADGKKLYITESHLE